MKKIDLVNAVAKVTCSKKEAKAAVETVLEGIKGSLKRGEKVTLVGFGSFEVRKRAARTGRNPQTGGKLNIPAKKVPIFRAGKELKKAVS